jgi:arylsulfatase A-like enzyme
MAVHEYSAPESVTAFPSLRETPLDLDAPSVGRVRKYGYLEAAIDAYDTSILYADSLLEELFEYLRNEEPNTLLIVTSDHGEEFYDHGGFGHGRLLYNEVLHVPLVAWGPGVPQATVTDPTSQVDLLPTIARYIGVSVDDSLPGAPLFSDGRASDGQRDVFAEQHHHGRWRRFTLFRDGAKLILSENKEHDEEYVEYYADGHGDERQDGSQGISQAALRSLEAGIRDHRSIAEAYYSAHVGSQEETDLTPDDIEKLRQLGYVE